MAGARVSWNVLDIEVCWSVGWLTMLSRAGVSLGPVCETDNTGEMPAGEILTGDKPASDAQQAAQKRKTHRNARTVLV